MPILSILPFEQTNESGGMKPRLHITVVSGATVTVTGEGETFTQVSNGTPLEFELNKYGTYEAVATTDSQTSYTVTTVVDTVKVYNIELYFFAATINVNVTTGSEVTCVGENRTLNTTSVDGVASFQVIKAGTYTITASYDGDTTTDTVTVTTDGQIIPISLIYCHIYGVEWDGTSTTVWSRTDEAAEFTNPVPYVAGSTSYSSPFDTLKPWRKMEIVDDNEAGKLVSIPKFWYKWTRSGSKMKLQISTAAIEGYSVSPGHQDRGDGKGERDVIYVGRYHCGSSAYKSVSGQSPKVSITRATARTSIAALGDTIWQFDYATLWTIWMLYLVEFGDWNSQKTIGYGCGNNSGVQAVGSSDSMPYHTGTMQSSRSTYGVGCQYRHIEDLWGNCFDWVDGIYFSSANIYAIKKPSSFSDTSGGTNIGTRPTSSNYISAWSNPTASGYQWALYPSAVGGSESTYVCDYCYYNSSGVVLYCGGDYSQYQNLGLFCLYGNYSASDSSGDRGCRLQKLP